MLRGASGSASETTLGDGAHPPLLHRRHPHGHEVQCAIITHGPTGTALVEWRQSFIRRPLTETCGGRGEARRRRARRQPTSKPRAARARTQTANATLRLPVMFPQTEAIGSASAGRRGVRTIDKVGLAVKPSHTDALIH